MLDAKADALAQLQAVLARSDSLATLLCTTAAVFLQSHLERWSPPRRENAGRATNSAAVFGQETKAASLVPPLEAQAYPHLEQANSPPEQRTFSVLQAVDVDPEQAPMADLS
jgi:hypothetical protein